MAENPAKRFVKGLFKDTSHMDQPTNTWRYAKNILMTNKEGSISNEGGTELSGHLGEDSRYGAQYDKVIGSIEVSDDRVILFIVGTDKASAAINRSEIGIWNDGIYTPIFNPDISTYPDHDLNFKTSNPIEGTYKIDPKEDLIIYWTDDLNPPRAFNISRQERWLDSAGTPSITWLYGIDPSTTPNKKHIELLNLFPNSGPIPHVEVHDVYWVPKPYQKSVIEGGGLRTGVYYLALAYVDDDFVTTNYLTVSNPVSIVDEFDHTVPTQKKDGAKEGDQTTKAIKWRASKLNTDYKYLRPAVIRKMGEATEVFKLNDIKIQNTIYTEIVFSGIEGFTSGSQEEIMIDTTAYETAKTIQQLDGVLYVGNLTGTKDIGYQKYANNIKLRSRVVKIEDFDRYLATVDNLESGFGTRPVNVFGQNTTPDYQDPSKSYRYIPNIVNFKGYMRDEIYAFYIAFIMNDGSMSYAYHIPGREERDDEKEELKTLDTVEFGGLWGDFQDISPGYAKRFHFIDAYSKACSDGNYDIEDYMGMNFWENATEFYPDTEDYEIWDENTTLDSDGLVVNSAGSLKGLNVRHHHFPSNKHPTFRSVKQANKCNTDKSQGTAATAVPWDGTLIFSQTAGNNGNPSINCNLNQPGSEQKYKFDDGYDRDTNYWAGNNDITKAQMVWHNQTTFIADQAMSVEVDWNVWFRKANGWVSIKDVHTTLRTDSLDWLSNNPGNEINKEVIYNFGSAGCGGSAKDYNGKGANGAGGPNPVTLVLQAGESIWIDTHMDPGCTATKKVNQASSSEVNFYPDPSGLVAENASVSSMTDCSDDLISASYIRFKIESMATIIDEENINDAKLQHDVQRLGFDLEDIKIPKSIADKVQGFKIYYAKRNHANRTILGQAPLLPGFKKKTQIGICNEAGNTASAQRVMSTLQTLAEDFWAVDPYPRTWSQYPEYPGIWQHTGSLSSDPTSGDRRGYKMFSFHDFYLLRTKNSLSTATHIDIQYRVRNLVFNGPGLNQDKKMLSLVREDKDSNGNIKLEIDEIWGWDTNTNCWSKDMRAAIFLGCEYMPTSYKAQPRILGQKAKTFLMGDSIFKGGPLGFGGKLFNEFGESSIVFSVKDGHEIPSYWIKSYRNESGTPSNLGVPSTFPPGLGNYGTINDSAPPILVNPLQSEGTWGGNGGQARSQLAITNLKAFKTDVYKSIDSQELIWTGFQVTGSDLDNFIFDEGGSPLTVTYNDSYNNITKPGDYKTWTLQHKIQGDSNNNSIARDQLGIFGGDTFICRYGFVTALKPSDQQTPSEPEKGIHFQIVESTDNINFRHAESDKSLYFPAATAKQLLRQAGTEDFTHSDNLKYNDNYSELNDIRPAFPLPLREAKQDNFPTRAHRSAKHDTTNLIDNYRIFLANQFKDLPKNRGELWKLASFNNLIYFHMEESLYAAQGKQTMQMQDGSEAFVGSGDIFAQEPEEMIQTEGGYGGTQSQWAAIVTRYGYFFVDIATRKIFLMGGSLTNVSDLGMKAWFRENLVFALESYGLPAACLDNPIEGIGLHSVWDPKHRRILLTKRDVTPTRKFINNYNGLDENGDELPVVTGATFLPGLIKLFPGECKYKRYQQKKNSSEYHWVVLEWTSEVYFTQTKSWTVSFYPELQIWIGFHQYTPYLYFNTSTDFYSFTDEYTTIDSDAEAEALGTDFGNAGIWKHNANLKGVLYQEAEKYPTSLIYHPFEFEFIHNEFAAMDALYYSFGYTSEVFGYNAEDDKYNLDILHHGFTSFLVYNTFQISGNKESSPLEYLINIRRKGSQWKVNKFRDMAAIALDTGDYYTPAGINVIGGTNTGTITTSSTVPMFTVIGMEETVSADYLNLAKAWNLQKKFIDKWLGIRLIYDNIENNLVNLYSTNISVRGFYR